MSDELAIRRREGVIFGLCAYVLWGFMPVYFNAAKEIPAVELLAQRVVWTLLLLTLILLASGRFHEIRRCLSSRRRVLLLLLTASLIAVNWLVYIYSVVSHQIVQSSLGYYINPLVSIFLGMIFFRERLRKLQWLALFLAATGVSYLAVGEGQLPWISLTIAMTFGLYGMFRKILAVEGILALNIEALFLMPAALTYLIYGWSSGHLVFLTGSTDLDLLIMASGLVTAVPLVCFGQAARRLPLTTMGFMQFLAPSIQFLLAILAFDEPFDRVRATCFGFIWTALIIVTSDSYWAYQQRAASRRRMADLAPAAENG